MLGGGLQLPTEVFEGVVAVVLVGAGVKLLLPLAANVDPQSALPPSANETGPPELPLSPGGPRDSVDASGD